MNAIARTNAEAFKVGFTRMKSQISAALPSHVPYERFERTVMMAVQKEPKLLECDQKSLFMECQKAAADGLLPDGREGVIVYRWNSRAGKNMAVWQPMVGGLMKLARNSGEIASLSSQVVFKGEAFRIVLGDEERIEHERSMELPDRPEIVGAYAVAVLKNGEKVREFMSWAQLEKVRAVNTQWSKGPWASWADEMSRKSVMRRLIKRLPLSTDRDADARFQAAVERVDDAVEGSFTESARIEEQTDRKVSKLDALEFAGTGEDEATEAEVVEMADEATP